MTADNESTDFESGDPIGPGTPAWKAGDDATAALVHCFKQIQPHVEKAPLEVDVFTNWGNSILAKALEQHKKLAA